jgi:hypothetical protein
MRKCDEVVSIFAAKGREIKVKCGDYYGGTKLFCRKCKELLIEAYPQGWEYYPGDVCEHGVYVGGCGIDYMCPQCEGVE